MGSLRTYVFLILSLLSAATVAGEVEQSATWNRPTVIVAAADLYLRTDPTLDAPVVTEVPLRSGLRVLDDSGPSLMIDGREDRWIHVATGYCADTQCKRVKAGWVPESSLGYDHRFERLAQWRSGIVAGYSLRSVFAYIIEPDGSFTRWTAPCGPGTCSIVAGVDAVCPEGQRAHAGFCILSGQLYRYRDLVRGKGTGGQWLDRMDVAFALDETGELCALYSEQNGADRMCDRSGPYASLGSAPETLLETIMQAQRQRLALVAADVLNVRAKPSIGARIVARLPRGSSVEVVDRDGPRIIIKGQQDHWVPIRIQSCAGEACAPGTAGWVVDGYLAYEHRLVPMAKWRQGAMGGYAGDYSFYYEVAENGTFRYSYTCGDDYREPEMCTATGQLLRYRDLVVAKSPPRLVLDILYIDQSGSLCLPLMKEFEYTFNGRASRCDR